MDDNGIQRDKFSWEEGDIEWVTSPDPTKSENKWVFPTGSLDEVLDYMNISTDQRRNWVRRMMDTPIWNDAPSHINDERSASSATATYPGTPPPERRAST